MPGPVLSAALNEGAEPFGDGRDPALASAAIIAGPGALVAAAPSALRLWAGSSGAGFFTSWLLVAGLLALPLWLVVVAARAGRAALAMDRSPRWTRLTLGGALALAFALPIDAALAAALKVHTHHRALGGAAFAVLALTVYLVAWVVCYRLASIVSGGAQARRAAQGSLRDTAAATSALTLAFGTVAALLLPLGRATPLRERALLLDLALALGVVAFGAAFNGRPAGGLLSRAGVLVVLALAAAAVSLLVIHPEMRAQVDAQAPLAAAWAQCLGFWE